MRAVEFGDRVVIVGQTGMGKTTLGKFLVGMLQPARTIIIDPKADYDSGIQPTSDIGVFEQQLRGPVAHFVPSAFDWDYLEEMCMVLWHTPGPYICVIDEPAEISKPNRVPTGARLLATQGRKERKMLMVFPQRLAECHPSLRSQAEHYFILVPPPIALDLQTLAGHIGIEATVLKGKLEQLHEQHGLYSHLWFVRTGERGPELRHCGPLELTGSDTGALGPAHQDDDALASPTDAGSEDLDEPERLDREGVS